MEITPNGSKTNILKDYNFVNVVSRFKILFEMYDQSKGLQLCREKISKIILVIFFKLCIKI